MESVNLQLSPAQIRKLKSGKKFQMSHKDLMGEGKGSHGVGLKMHSSAYKQMMRNKSQGKGFRFSPEHFFNSVKDAAHSVKEGLKKRPVLSKVLDKAILPAAKKGLEMAGKPFEAVSGFNPATVGYDIGHNYVGPALLGKGLKKGSPEMAEKMARLRAMRGKNKKVGGDLVDAAKDVGKKAVNAAREILGVGAKPRLLGGKKGLHPKYRAMIQADADENEGGAIIPISNKITLPNGKNRLNTVAGGKGLKKGSPEMKEKMARLRALRGKKKKKGGDLLDDIGNALDPKKNGVSDTFNKVVDTVSNAGNSAVNAVAPTADDAIQKVSQIGNKIKDAFVTPETTSIANSAIASAAETFKRGGSAEDFGKKVASALIHQGIPEATAYVCGAAAEAAFPEGGIAAGYAGSVAGKELGKIIAQKVGDATGYGLRKGKDAVFNSRIHTIGGNFLDGIPLPIYTKTTLDRIDTHGLISHHKNKNGLYNGGSFLPLGSKGGSFVSP